MTTEQIVGTYRGRGHWYVIAKEPGRMGWGLKTEPPINPPPGCDFHLDVSPPPPFGPQEFAIEIEFKRGTAPYRIPRVIPVLAGLGVGLAFGGDVFHGSLRALVVSAGASMSITSCVLMVMSYMALRRRVRHGR